MKQLKNIVFDLGGVLIDWNPEYMYKKIIPDEHERKAFLDNICTMSWNEEQDGGRSIQEANDLLLSLYPDKSDYILAFYQRWEEMLNGPIEGTVEVLKLLKSNNQHRIYALTNWSAETFPRALELFDFLHWFDGRIVSGEEKTRKPFTEIYELTLSRFCIDASETLFIDDNLRNIKAAEACGIQCIHFQSPALLINELKKRAVI
jgi:2-haloacid dehalogenase